MKYEMNIFFDRANSSSLKQKTIKMLNNFLLMDLQQMQFTRGDFL